MRRFYLHSYDGKEKFDLNTRAAIALEPQGLGNAFSPSYQQSEKGKHLTNVTPSFEPISFKVCFNADGSGGYGNYKALLQFLARCGISPFLFEYDDGVTDKYCDVILKSHTKSELGEDGALIESFSFERQSFWYERLESSFDMKRNDERSTEFPLPFPFGFVGLSLVNSVTLKNPFFIHAPITVTISGYIGHDVELAITDAASKETVARLMLLCGGNESGDVIVIDPNQKKITRTDANGTVKNGYDLTDKRFQSFLYLPQGEYTVQSNLEETDSGSIKLSVKRYLLD